MTADVNHGVPDGAWRIDYADGSGNRYALVADGATVEITYDPMTPARSSSGTYSGGPPRHAVVAHDDARLATLWARVRAACAGPAVARGKGTGAFELTVAGDVRTHVVPRGPDLAMIDALLATFGA